jgi:hypothetical protein
LRTRQPTGENAGTSPSLLSCRRQWRHEPFLRPGRQDWPATSIRTSFKGQTS